MFKQLSLIGLAAISAQVLAKDDFSVVGVRSSNPANIKIDLRIDNATDKTRPSSFGNQFMLVPLDIRKIMITENGSVLSNSEGSKAAAVQCTSCSSNFIHMTLDYSGSVRGQHYKLVNAADKFLEKLKGTSGNTYIRLSFFAGDRLLFNPIGKKNWYYSPSELQEILYSCENFTLNGEKSGTSLCNSDTATRLNTAIMNNINDLEIAKNEFFQNYANASYTSVIFSDGKNRDAGVEDITVKDRIASFKASGGNVYAVTMTSDENDTAYFNNLNPTKIFRFKKIEKFADKLVDVFEDLNNKLPVFYSLRICSAVRGGANNLALSSKKYKIPKFQAVLDATNFSGGCDVEKNSQWRF